MNKSSKAKVKEGKNEVKRKSEKKEEAWGKGEGHVKRERKATQGEGIEKQTRGDKFFSINVM